MIKTKPSNGGKFSIHLFEAAEKENLITAGKPEEQLASEVYDLAFEKFRISNHWHKLVQSNSFFLLSLFK
jgi:hypothetical protein